MYIYTTAVQRRLNMFPPETFYSIFDTYYKSI